MNNLHINANLLNDEINCKINQISDVTVNINSDESNDSSNNYLILNSSYSPSLDITKNPIYFESNRILFEAHKCRIFRQQNQKNQC